MSQALLFGRISSWEKIKLNLITCALCVVAATPNGAVSQVQRLRMIEDIDSNDDPAQGRLRARSLSDIAKMENLPEVLGRLRPFFIMLSLVDLIKKTWDSRVPDESPTTSIQEYHDRLFRDYLTKGNLKKVTDDSNLFYKTYNEKLTKVESIEGFLLVLGLIEKVVADFTTVDKFILSHF